jgi:DNA-binding CsgD family transcriptional regulator
MGAVTDELERAREAYRRRAWRDAYDLLSAADGATPLSASDLELLATASHLIDDEPCALAALERAHRAHVEAKDRLRAARCAFWMGLFLLLRGETGRATGWLGRSQRLIEPEPSDCVERGYLLLPAAEQQLGSGDGEAAHATATRAASVGERCGDVGLTACARHLEGRALLLQGSIVPGLALLDEAMLTASGRDVSPVLTGMIYCSVIDACLGVYAFSRAREWTAVLTQWCADQPQLVAFTGTCVVHRAQVLQLSGVWRSALAEVRGACDRFARGTGQRPPGAALYEQAEVYRLRGELGVAEEAYGDASRMGCEPQPGLALLRLAQGRLDAAEAALRHLVSAATGRLQRSRLLPAYIEVLLAAGDVAGARQACDDLGQIADGFPIEALAAIHAQARASVELAEGNPTAAIASARFAWDAWERIEAPYFCARSRELIGLACRALGDDDGCRLQLDAARSVFEKLEAAPDAARLAALMGAPRPAARPKAHPSGLTARELEVLRLVAAGGTNKAIGRELHLSEKTVERHLSHIFSKLDVPSRSAATAYAYKNKLV